MNPVGDQLSVSLRPGPDGHIATLHGRLDGTFDPTRWPGSPGALLIDAAPLTGADTAGLARWQAMLSQWGAREIAFIQLHLPPTQAAALVGSHPVISLQLSMVCPQCRSLSTATFDLRLPFPDPSNALGGPACRRCEAPTTIDAGGLAMAAPWRARPRPVLSAHLEILLELVPDHGVATDHSFIAKADAWAGVGALWLQGPVTEVAVLPRRAASDHAVVVADSVTGADPLGVRNLIDWLRSSPNEVTLVGVPITLVRALAREARAFSGVIGSLVLRADCSFGHANAIEISGYDLTDLQQSGRRSVSCPVESCSARATVSLSSEAVAALERLTIGSIAGPVSAYLARPPPEGMLPRARRGGGEPSFDEELGEPDISSATPSDETLIQRQSLFGSSDDLREVLAAEAEGEPEQPPSNSWLVPSPSLPVTESKVPTPPNARPVTAATPLPVTAPKMAAQPSGQREVTPKPAPAPALPPVLSARVAVTAPRLPAAPAANEPARSVRLTPARPPTGTVAAVPPPPEPRPTSQAGFRPPTGNVRVIPPATDARPASRATARPPTLTPPRRTPSAESPPGNAPPPEAEAMPTLVGEDFDLDPPTEKAVSIDALKRG